MFPYRKNKFRYKGFHSFYHHHKIVIAFVKIPDVFFAEIATVKYESDIFIPISHGLVQRALRLTDIDTASGGTAAMESEPKLVVCPDGDFEETIPIRSKYDGRRTILIQPDSASLVLNPEELSPLQKAVLQGLHYSDLMETSQAKSLTGLAEQLDVERTFLYHSLELVNLAPDIISAILKGEIPAELKLKNLRGNIPTSWEEQRMLYGFKKA